MLRTFFILSLITAFTSCSSNESTSQASSSEIVSTEHSDQGTAFTGKVVFNEFAGGFWGIITSDGQKLHGPINVNLQKKGLVVKGFYTIKTGVISMRMWGKPASFSNLKAQ